ncbi:MAG TPA: aminotransferase class V-fold PLP-dependent enzyme [bacterium]|nr:aminotransferase class V-fold PLP-dependent enzyme [bacterium]
MERIYLDYNATTPVRAEVRDAVLPFLNDLFGNPSSRHLEGRQVKTKIEAARAQVATAIGAEPERIVFNAGATEGNVTILRGYQVNYKEKKGRDHIIISAVEHPCIYDTAKKMAGEGYAVTFVPVDGEGNIDLDGLKKAITERTGLISVMAVNNETGVIYPVKEIAKIAREKGILFHTDAAQAIGKMPFDVKDIDADFVTMSAHKFYAPKGIGALYIKKGKRLDPLLTGGHQEANRRAGTENVVGMIAMGRALELATGELATDRERIGKIRDEFERRILAEVPHSRRNGGADNRLYTTSNISFRFVEGEAVQLKLDHFGIAVSTGSACSSGTLDPSHVVMAMCNGDEETAHSSIRFSFGKYSKMEEIGYVVDRVKEVVAQLRSFSPLYDKFLSSQGK